MAFMTSEECYQHVTVLFRDAGYCCRDLPGLGQLHERIKVFHEPFFRVAF